MTQAAHASTSEAVIAMDRTTKPKTCSNPLKLISKPQNPALDFEKRGLTKQSITPSWQGSTATCTETAGNLTRKIGLVKELKSSANRSVPVLPEHKVSTMAEMKSAAGMRFSLNVKRLAEDGK
jgi:hypothetical protein